MTDSLVTFLFEIANFAAFVVLLGWLFIKPVRKFLDEQAAQDAQTRDAARQQLEEARRLRDDAQRQHQQLAQELERQKKTAVAEAREDAQRQITAAEQEIARRREQFQREMERDQEMRRSELTSQVAAATGIAVSRLLSELGTVGLDSALLKTACEELASLGKPAEGNWVVESAQPLTAEQQQQVFAALASNGPKPTIAYRVDPDLLGGVRILGPEGMIDHSVAGLAEYLQRKMQQDLKHHG